MSLLWKGGMKMNQQTIHRSPSPTCSKKDVNDVKNSLNAGSIEGTSLFASHGKSLKKAPGSMTVEAAIVLPLFLFFFLNLGCAIELIRLHGNLELALWETGNRMCVYGAALSESESLAGVGSMFSYFYVKSEVIDYVGEEYLEQSPLTHGGSGLRFLESKMLSARDTLEINMTYEVSSFHPLANFYPFRMANRYYGHLWTGFQLPLGADGGKVETVYVAETGEVYHVSASCTHLKLSIQEVTLQEALTERNGGGAQYVLCSLCGDMPRMETVFITDEGECYHYTKECSGLKRTIYSMSREEAAEKYRPCMRCAGGGA